MFFGGAQDLNQSGTGAVLAVEKAVAGHTLAVTKRFEGTWGRLGAPPPPTPTPKLQVNKRPL